MNIEDLASMQAQITSGTVHKSHSRFVTDEGSAKLWDDLSAEIAEQRGKGLIVEQVNEIP